MAYEEGMKKILNVAGKLVHSSGPLVHSRGRHTSIPDPTHPLDIAQLTLPDSSTVIPRLTRAGLPPHMADRLANVYNRAAELLRAQYQDSLVTLCRRLAETQSHPDLLSLPQLYARLHAVHEKQFKAKLSSWVTDKLLTSVHTWRRENNDRRSRPVEERKFNQDFTPFLVKCFEKDAYPTQADRALFARKSMMTPRQIEVWFQNHRRRARKEGKPVVRRRPDDRSPIDLEALAQSMPDLFIPEGQRPDIEQSDWINDDDEMDDLSDEEDVPDWTEKHVPHLGTPDLLDVEAPSHAFPTIFSECRNYHAFPTTDEGFTFPSPIWTRKPATQRVNRPSPDFEDLTTRFERLSLLTPLMTGSRKTGSGKYSRQTSTEPLSSKRKFPLPTTFTPITPPIGRHPAFVPTQLESYVSSATSKPTIPIVRAPGYRLHAFQTPAPESPPVSLLPPSAPSSSIPVYKKIPPRRQVARLPRRTPQSQSVAHRTSPIHPVTTPSSPSPSSVSSGSRTSSFESLFSSHTRTSSSGSDTSLPNMPITPTFSPTPLQPPAPVAATDFSFTDDLFGDSLFDLSFPPNAFQLNGFGNAAKQVQAPSYNDFNFNFTPSQFLQA